MNFFSILAAVGMIAIAGGCGVLLGWIEKKAWENETGRKWDD